MGGIRAHETDLAAALVRAVAALPGATILGDPEPARARERVPTVSFTLAGRRPAAVVDHLAASGIQAREGHMYAPQLVRAAGFDPDTGVVRVSLCHYNTAEEIERFARALQESASSPARSRPRPGHRRSPVGAGSSRPTAELRSRRHGSAPRTAPP
jgi:selenocysteine lyase/cysteine desulfurase